MKCPWGCGWEGEPSEYPEHLEVCPILHPPAEPTIKVGDIVEVPMQPGLWRVTKAPPGLYHWMRAGIADVKRPPSMEGTACELVPKEKLPENALENVKQFFGVEPGVRILIKTELRTFTEEPFKEFVRETGKLPLVVSVEAVERISREEFSKKFNDALIEWIPWYIELHKPGFRGELHYEVPELEEETIGRFTPETVDLKWRDEIRKRQEDLWGAYQETKAPKMFLKRVPEAVRHFASDLVVKMERELFEEAKTRAREKRKKVTVHGREYWLTYDEMKRELGIEREEEALKVWEAAEAAQKIPEWVEKSLKKYAESYERPIEEMRKVYLKLREIGYSPIDAVDQIPKALWSGAYPRYLNSDERTWLIRDKKLVEVEGRVEEPVETPKLAEGVVTEEEILKFHPSFLRLVKKAAETGEAQTYREILLSTGEVRVWSLTPEPEGVTFQLVGMKPKMIPKELIERLEYDKKSETFRLREES